MNINSPEEKHNKHILHQTIHKFYNMFDQMNNLNLMFHIDYNQVQLKDFETNSNHLIDKKVGFHHKYNYLDNKLNHLFHNKLPKFNFDLIKKKKKERKLTFE